MPTFLRIWGGHHLKAGSDEILLLIAYSAVSIGWEIFISRSGTYDVMPSFYDTRNFHPLVVQECRVSPDT